MARPCLSVLFCLLLSAGCRTATSPIPADWTVPTAQPSIAEVQLDAQGRVTHSAVEPRKLAPQGTIRVETGAARPRLMNGETPLTEAFDEIDSFDVSDSRGEVAFSAKKGESFDIGLVSVKTSPISWIPADPADERSVRWALRGNKISYVIRAGSGDLIRTVHIPTAFQLAVDFPWGTVQAYGWDPQAERFAVAWSSPDASERVEVMRYGGEERRLAIPPRERLEVDMEPFSTGALLMRPRDLRYGEKVPVVIWQVETFAWNESVASLAKTARIATIVTRRAPDEELWKQVAATTWIDGTRPFVVGASGTVQSGGTRIVGDPSVPRGQYLQQTDVVRVEPSVVQSFAARFIADALRRTNPLNGSSQ